MAQTCSVPGCQRGFHCKGFCKLHYRRWYKHGDPQTVLKGGQYDRTGEHNPHWRGGEATRTVRQRNSNLKRYYGITLDEFDTMLAGQGGRCAICHTDDPTGLGRWNQWHVDHCHATDKVRAILCPACNVMIGHANDDPKRLRAAASYLEKR